MQTKALQSTPPNLRLNSRAPQNKKEGAPAEGVTAESGIEQAEYMVQMKQLRLEVILGTKENIQKQASASVTINEIFENSSPESHAGLIDRLTQDEATELVSEDGYYGINKTSERLAEFVLKGGGNDLDRLRAGREGILRGYHEAEKAWGGSLPEISQQTLDKSLAMIDEKIRELGGSVLETSA